MNVNFSDALGTVIQHAEQLLEIVGRVRNMDHWLSTEDVRGCRKGRSKNAKRVLKDFRVPGKDASVDAECCSSRNDHHISVVKP